jgi:hypothetical protein
MKFLKNYNVKHSTRLFQGKYKYKIVFTSGVAGWFRGNSVGNIRQSYERKDSYYHNKTANPIELTHALKMSDVLETMEDWNARVETPFVSIYLNNERDLESIVKNCKDRVKYVEIPDPKSQDLLTQGFVLVKKLDFKFRVSLGISNQNHCDFVHWCENNPKIRMPKRAKRDLTRDGNTGGGFFYVKDEKSLTMVKMFLGRTITRVETVVQS